MHRRTALVLVVLTLALTASVLALSRREAAAAARAPAPAVTTEWREVRHALTASFLRYVAGDNPELHSIFTPDLNSRMFVAR